MKRTIVNSALAVLAALAPAATFAQSEQQGWLVETMYRSGKINTVVIVVSVVLVGLAVWMFALDRRIGKLEKNAFGK